ncbi:MAG: hypothetical protein M1834_000383 [Cirrosporium novae-zelandiae]|nr:MAG: hypothetical protein M1834_000383 [Cirrosporium novae-zelandiae]
MTTTEGSVGAGADTSSDSAPTPASSVSAKGQQIRYRLPEYLGKADDTIAHFNRAGTGTTLLTLNYTALLLSTYLARLSQLQLKPLTSRLTKAAILLPGDNATLLAIITSSPHSNALLHASKTLRALADMISDHRNFRRLFGLLGIYSWAVSTYRYPPKDRVLKSISWIQVFANVLYQYLENAAYLTRWNVVKLSKAQTSSYWLWSSRWWMLHVVLDIGRLLRERQLRAREEGTSEKDVSLTEQENARWWKEWWVNIAYLPLTVHWSLEEGCVSEDAVGALGSVAGILGFRQAWRETA